jgi:xylulokinase
MMADVFGYPVKTVASSEAPALGVAILAGVGAGLFPSVQEACASIIQEQTSVTPNSANQAEYQKYYALYGELYPVLAPEYKALAKID